MITGYPEAASYDGNQTQRACIRVRRALARVAERSQAKRRCAPTTLPPLDPQSPLDLQGLDTPSGPVGASQSWAHLQRLCCLLTVWSGRRPSPHQGPGTALTLQKWPGPLPRTCFPPGSGAACGGGQSVAPGHSASPLPPGCSGRAGFCVAPGDPHGCSEPQRSCP